MRVALIHRTLIDFYACPCHIVPHPYPLGIHLMNGAKPLSADPKYMQLIGIRHCWAETTLLLIANPGLTKAGNKAPYELDRILIYLIMELLKLELLIHSAGALTNGTIKTMKQ